MRSIQELGATAWIKKNPTEADEKNLILLDFANDPNAIQTLINRTDATLDLIEELGRTAQMRGYLSDNTEKEIPISRKITKSVLRRVHRGWRDIDGTTPRGDEDDQRRYKVGTRNTSARSCAVDSAIYCAIMLDAGRIQIDQLAAREEGLLQNPARTLRSIVNMPWGNIPQQTRDQARDELINELVQHNPTCHPQGDMFMVNVVLEDCFRGLPQVTYTIAHQAQVCCDGFTTISDAQTAVLRTNVLSMPGKDPNHSFQDHLNAWLGRRNVNVSEPCSRGGHCSRRPYAIRIIVDRLPPTLMVQLPSTITSQENERWKLFDDLNLTYRDPKGNVNVRYTPVGCVFLTGGSHFIVHWKLDEAGNTYLMHHDGLKGAKATRIDDWWSGIRKGADKGYGVVTIFYRQIDTVAEE